MVDYYFLYSLNESFHCSWFNGGRTPNKGFQSTIDKPDCVNLVAPPISIIINTDIQQKLSQNLPKAKREKIEISQTIT